MKLSPVTLRLLPFGLLVATASAVFLPVLSGRWTLYPTDITDKMILPFAASRSGSQVQDTSVFDLVMDFYPLHMFQAKSFRSGRLPLWNPDIFGGQPAFASSGTTVTLDPFNILLLMADTGRALAWRTYLQIVACMLFMYMFLKELGLSSLASILGSLGYGLNSMS